MTRSCWSWSNSRSGELLTQYEFPGDDTPIIQVSALKAWRAMGRRRARW